MSFLEISAYEFSDIKSRQRWQGDKEALQHASKMVACALECLERINDEYNFPTGEYETLAEIRTDLINYAQDCED